MINIPTELLRALIAVVDLRSFTKAAHSLNVTQPAISAQLKRLQILLDTELFDKSAPGVTLTASGAAIVKQSRRLLSINDEIVDFSMPRAGRPTLRIGLSGDFAASVVPRVLVDVRARRPGHQFKLSAGHFGDMVRDLQHGDLDMLIGMSEQEPALAARHRWVEEIVWIRNPARPINPKAHLPLALFEDTCPIHRATIQALNDADVSFDLVLMSSNPSHLIAAVAAGLGISAMPQGRFGPHVETWTDAPLPRIGNMFCGIYLRDGGDQDVLQELADAFAVHLNSGMPVQGRGQVAAGQS